MLTRLTQAARWLLAFELVLNGVNWWWKLLPYPSMWDAPLAHTPPFVQAMIDTGFLFAGIKVIEVVTGLMLFANRWVPLALVVAFPVTVGAWSVDVLLISTSVRAQLLGWSVLALNGFLLVAYLPRFAPMLVARATPWTIDADGTCAVSGTGGSLRRNPALAVFGWLAVASGTIASGWLIVMTARQLAR